MASGLPKQPYVYRKRLLPDIEKSEESPQEPAVEERNEEPAPQGDEVALPSHSDIEIHINKKKAIAFLLFGILFYTLSTTADSFSGVFSDNLKIAASRTSVEVAPGSDVSLPLIIENTSFFEKNASIRIDSPWRTELCTETCFQGGVLALKARTRIPLTMRVWLPSDAQSGVVNISARGREEISLSFAITVSQKEAIILSTGTVAETQKGKHFTVTVRNGGNVGSHCSLSLGEIPDAWQATVSESEFTLAAGEEKDISIEATSDVPSSSFSSVLTATTNGGFSTTLLLASRAASLYDFSVSYEPRYSISKGGGEIHFVLANRGNVPDSYAISLTSYPSDWSITLTQREVSLAAGEEKVIPLFIVPATERHTALLLNVTSEATKASRNVTLQLTPQTAARPAVLAEHFTATWCFVCPIAERAIERVAQETPALIVLNYHLQDSLTTPGSEKRAQGLYGIGVNVSTTIFNGTKMVPFLSGGEDALYERYKKFFADLISAPQNFEVYLSGYVEGNTAFLDARILPLLQKNYEVHFVVFRDPFKYKTSLRRYVVRDVLTPEKVVTGGEKHLQRSFPIPADDLGNGGSHGLGIAVIIQDPATKEVWQVALYSFG